MALDSESGKFVTGSVGVVNELRRFERSGMEARKVANEPNSFDRPPRRAPRLF